MQDLGIDSSWPPSTSSTFLDRLAFAVIGLASRGEGLQTNFGEWDGHNRTCVWIRRGDAQYNSRCH
jgi:hypothetical protein